MKPTATSVRGYTIYYTDNNLNYSSTRVLSTGLTSMKVNDIQGIEAIQRTFTNKLTEVQNLDHWIKILLNTALLYIRGDNSTYDTNYILILLKFSIFFIKSLFYDKSHEFQ